MNIYYEQVRNLTISPELCEEYISLCKRFASYKDKNEAKEILGVNVEAHHILPKSFKMGGEKDKTNITYLPMVEHRLAHKLLKDMFEGKLRRDMAFGYSRIIHRHGVKDVIPLDEYSDLRSEVGKLIGDNNRIKNKTKEHRATMSRVKKGTRWINNGQTEAMIGPNDLIPEGWVDGRLVCSIRGRIWINNGTVNKMIPMTEKIPSGWSSGMFKTSKKL